MVEACECKQEFDAHEAVSQGEQGGLVGRGKMTVRVTNAHALLCACSFERV